MLGSATRKINLHLVATTTILALIITKSLARQNWKVMLVHAAGTYLHAIPVVFEKDVRLVFPV